MQQHSFCYFIKPKLIKKIFAFDIESLTSNIQNRMIVVFLVALFYTHHETVQYVPIDRVTELLALWNGAHFFCAFFDTNDDSTTLNVAGYTLL